MRVDELRIRLRRHGVSGVSGLRKPELVKALARAMRSARRSGGAGRTSTGPAGRAARSGARATTGAKSTRAKAAPARTRKAAPASARKATSASARRAAPASARKVASASARRPAAASTTRKTTAGRSAPARKPASARKAAPAGRAAAGSASGIRTGPATSRSVRSSQRIGSPADQPERPGRSLVTTNHEVIRRWARARSAKPATIAGTERAGRPGVLTFNFPGYRESSRIREITWDEWFRTFDSRRLNLIFQEQLRDGRQSNFFRTESPQRSDG
ncbi:hypothetical protein [Micromonospora yangpuensis]|nr:hypothetical protein [Micromonospora yangpuensis]